MGKRSTKGNYDNTPKGMALNKQLLLEAVEEWGGNTKALKAAGISRTTYFRWVKDDPDFSSDLEYSKRAFGEKMLEVAIDRVRNPDKNRGSDLLLISLLNAYMGHVFKPGTVVGEDSAKELVTEWRRAARQELGSQEVLSENIEETLESILEKKGKEPGNGDTQVD